MSMEFNFADCFELVADTVPERTAIVSGDRRLTYATFDERTTRFAHALAAAGVEPGEHVGLYLHNQAEHLEAMLGCYKRRAVPINVNYRYGPDELAYLFDDAEIVALVYGAEYREIVTGLRPRLAKLRVLIEVGDGDARRPIARRRLRVGARGRADDPGVRAPLGRRPLRALHRRHDRHAERRRVAAGRHVLRDARRREPGRHSDRASRRRSRTRCS